ncbi:MAG: SH3 domain-containing protein [Firmicutes bacterium]|nr:SH3 domain-containing protein [Bacillota bacterium]
MFQSSLISLLTIILYIASLFGFGGGSQAQAPDVPRLEEPAPANSASGRFELSTGVTVKVGDYVRVSGDVVNIRTGPGTSYPALTKAKRGQAATVEDGSNGWLKLRFQDNLTGWVADWLVTPAEPGRIISPHVPAGLQTIGYYATSYPGDDSSLRSMAEAGSTLTGVAPFLFTVDSYGNIFGDNDWQAMEQAKKAGRTTLALVHNVRGDWFNTQVAHNLLSKEVNRTRAINQILDILKKYGYDGVNLDLEAVKPSDRNYLTSFVRELSWALRPKGYLLTISVPAKTWDDRNNSWSGAYDYKAIGEYADWVMIMAYDQHYKTGRPGPVAAIDWVEQVVKYAISTIPREKIILGVPTYGYDWPTNGNPGRSVSYAQAMKIARDNGIQPKWHPTYKVPYFSYVSGSMIREVWFESSWSLEYKLDLVKKYGLKGIALWRLGLEDPRTWEVIGAHLY